MTTIEKINELSTRQLELRATMQKSDEHALKCAKSGLDFKETYPDDWAEYELVREEYNENETALAALYEQRAAEEEAAQAEMMSATAMNAEE